MDGCTGVYVLKTVHLGTCSLWEGGDFSCGMMLYHSLECKCIKHSAAGNAVTAMEDYNCAVRKEPLLLIHQSRHTELDLGAEWQGPGAACSPPHHSDPGDTLPSSLLPCRGKCPVS